MSASKAKKLILGESAEPPPIIKKVQAYPIPVQITKDGLPPNRAKIFKLTDVGFLVKVIGQKIFKVGDDYNVEFDVPTTDKTIKQPVKIVKTYDNYDNRADQNNLEKVYTIEMHFKILTPSEKEAIHYFIKKIGQK